MAQEKILIKFQPEGNKALTKAISELDAATRRLTGQQNNYVKSSNGVRNASRGLSLSFATLRSHMLLYSFAMSLGVRQLIQFGKESARLKGVTTAFKTLQGGTVKATDAILKLRLATDGTMSSMDLLKQANNAMILGITKNSDEMAEMFDIAQRLGEALGVDTAHAVESLITGIGRQSRLMLDNIGIVVKTEEAYENYAKKLRTTTDRLTDVQKKEAFLNATMESARKKVAQLGKETDSNIKSWNRFGATLKNVATDVGSAVNKLLVPALNAVSNVLEKDINPETALLSNNTDLVSKAIKQQINNYNNLSQIARNAAIENEDMNKTLEEMQLNIDLLREHLRKLSMGIPTEALIFLEESLDNIANSTDITGTKLEGLNDQETALLKTTTRFADVLADAALNSKNMGDAFVSAIRAMAAELLAKAAIFALMEIVFPGSGQKAAGAKSAGFDSFFKFVFAHTGGLIKNDGGIQRFANGGTVKGVDNVPIMAQAGEFVMSRRAVDAVGVETMNRINKTGSAGNINVNVSGNILTQDFVEGELADAIKKAARRGSDFGLS